MSQFNTQSMSSAMEQNRRRDFFELFRNSPIPDQELLLNIGLYSRRQNISHLFFMQHLYQQMLNVHGVIMEFGVRWGQNLAFLHSLRGIYEPYNYNRKIIGFDTFAGFPEVHAKDGSNSAVGDYAVSPDYKHYLERVLEYHESESPLSHISKFELVQGDAVKTVSSYLNEHPETIIALAYFDFDIYLPTKECLEKIKGHLTKGSVVAFDELNYSKFPGETLAFKEVFGLDRYAIRRTPYSPLGSYIVIE